MKLQIRLVAIADHGPEQVHEIASLQRTELKLETLGLLWRKVKPFCERSSGWSLNGRSPSA